MAAVRIIQRNIEVGDLSMRAGCRVEHLHHSSSATGKEILYPCRRRETSRPRLCVWDCHVSGTVINSACIQRALVALNI